jgi:hypothetical protein
MKKTLVMSVIAMAAAMAWTQCVETPDGVKLEKGGKTVWAFNITNPECKPFIHPLTLPDGRAVTDVRPSDHIWHLGAWFCWKYINGVNYWEPAGNKGVLPDGKTTLREKKIETKGDAATVSLKLDYAERKKPGEIVLREERTVTFSAPDTTGAYVITSAHHFVAGKAAVKLDRTPPYQHGKGKDKAWAGGYAGFAVRFAPLMKGFQATSSSGESSQEGIRSKETKWVDFSDPANGHGVTVELVKGTPETHFYTWADRRFVCPSVVYSAPLTLQPGETLDLVFVVKVH